MKIVVLGATGQTGRRFVSAASGSHHIISFGRREAQGAHVSHIGAFGDPQLVDAVMHADAVVSCLASSNKQPVCSQATAAVLSAKPNVRYLTVAGAAVDQPEDRKGLPDKTIGMIMRIVAGGMLADRQKEIEMLRSSSARWTVLRPPRLVNDKPTGHWQVSYDRPAATWIDRGDLAAALLYAVEEQAFLNAAPFVAVQT